MVLNIAHRGGAGLAPENTISCFKIGIEFSDMIELDIQPSKDKYLMVFHDRAGIERTTNGKGKIPELTFKYLKSLDAGFWFHPDYKGEKIPTLSEVIKICLPNNILFNIELKYYDQSSSWFEEAVMTEVKQQNIEKRTIITTRYVESIRRIQEIYPQFYCTLLQKERGKEEYFKQLLALNLKTAQIRRNALEKSFIKNCHDNGIQVFFFYADEDHDMDEATGLDVDGILTNYPNRLKTFLANKF